MQLKRLVLAAALHSHIMLTVTTTPQPQDHERAEPIAKGTSTIMAEVTYTADMLARHSTLATFTGFEQGREPMLRVFPPRPAKSWATFQIDE